MDELERLEKLRMDEIDAEWYYVPNGSGSYWLHEESGVAIGARAILDRAVRLESQLDAREELLKGAGNALRSYQYGNGAPDLAKAMADNIDAVLQEDR